MIVTLKTQGLQTLEQVRAFLAGAQPLDFEAPSRQTTSAWLAAAWRRFPYLRLGKADKGAVRGYLEKVTGLSSAQMSRRIRQFRETGHLVDRRGPPARPFARRYPDAAVRLLAESDARHGTLSGPATRQLGERAYTLFGDLRYERLAAISIAHLYHLRGAKAYRRQRGAVDKTRPAKGLSGERRTPRPEGRPGFLRVDSVHQGDLDGIKGLYHSNRVDAVTQFQFVGRVERIAEQFLLPILEALIAALPFQVLDFHSDHGAEYINHRIAALLEKRHSQAFTKSRARRSNDNALAESNNGAVVRKHLGYAHIPGRHAAAVNRFTPQVLSPYRNFHRPGFFPTEVVDAKGRLRQRYPYAQMMTPYDKLKALPQAAQYLKPGITFVPLDDIATAISDNEAARRLNEARAELVPFH